MKKLLIVVDYQNDFVIGSLGFEKARLLEDKIEQKIESFIVERQDIVFTMDTHDSDYLFSREGINLPVVHCLDHSDGQKIYGKIASYAAKYPVLKKNTFGSIELMKYLQNKEYDRIELCGVVTNMCVLANAIICQSVLPNAQIVILKNLVAAVDEKLEQETFDVLKAIYIENE